jgi:predicted  nucleic acid-binding Zn-ribbon protein
MKKATAFLTLVGLLTMLGGGIYLVKFFPTPEKFEPLIENVSALVAEQYRSPALIGLSLFWLAGFLTSLMVLFERKKSTEEPALTEKEKPEEELPKPEQAEQAKAEMVLKSDLDASILACEQAEQKISRLETEIEGLKTQLEKFSVTEEDKEEVTRLENEIKRLEGEVKRLENEVENEQKKLGGAEEDKKRLSLEIEALTLKVSKAQEEDQAARKEIEKTRSELKQAKAEAQKNGDDLVALKEEHEKIKAELQAALADAKSGKHGIPPAAYQILYLFQKEGRLIDLLMEDVSDFDDETLGGAIRPIHEGCRKLLKERLVIEPVLDEEEGSEITIEEADPESIKLSGNVPAKGPYKGELVHRGWRLKECHLPELVDGWTGNVVAPAEIEIN